jgi:hypothetical protein
VRKVRRVTTEDHPTPAVFDALTKQRIEAGLRIRKSKRTQCTSKAASVGGLFHWFPFSLRLPNASLCDRC